MSFNSFSKPPNPDSNPFQSLQPNLQATPVRSRLFGAAPAPASAAASATPAQPFASIANVTPTFSALNASAAAPAKPTAAAAPAKAVARAPVVPLVQAMPKEADDGIDRAQHPSGIVPVLQYVPSALCSALREG